MMHSCYAHTNINLYEYNIVCCSKVCLCNESQRSNIGHHLLPDAFIKSVHTEEMALRLNNRPKRSIIGKSYVFSDAAFKKTA